MALVIVLNQEDMIEITTPQGDVIKVYVSSKGKNKGSIPLILEADKKINIERVEKNEGNK